jgi:hypothetical protein
VTANPLADAVSKFLTASGAEPPIYKVIASRYCEPGNMLIMDPTGTGIVDIATEVKHPGLKLIACPTEADAERVRGWARELDLDLLEDE